MHLKIRNDSNGLSFSSLFCFIFSGSGWQQLSQVYGTAEASSRPIGKYPERQFGNAAAIEHGKKLRHQSKNPEYLTKLGVNNGVKGSGRPYIDTSLSTRNQTVLVGKQIILRCHIEDVGNQSVSFWPRVFLTLSVLFFSGWKWTIMRQNHKTIRSYLFTAFAQECGVMIDNNLPFVYQRL